MSKTHTSKSSHWTPPSHSPPSSSFKPPTVGIQPATGRWQSTEETAGWQRPIASEVGKSYLSNSIQTKCDACEGQEKEENLEVQTKLTVGEPGDKYEQEADATAAKVVKQINSPGFNESVQTKVEPVVKPTVMRHGGVAGGGVDPGVEQSIQGARGSGQGLSEKIKKPMERVFGADFSGVKVHTDGNANQLNRSLHSRAFATGQDIFFKQGEYNPGSLEGQKLVAHELTHVVQQGSAPGIQQQSINERSNTNIQSKKTNTEMAVSQLVQLYPGDGMKPPGDCSDLEYKALRAAVEATKKVKGQLGGCSNKDDCPTLATKIAAIAAELSARTVIMTKCFRGGNRKHREHITQLNNNMMRCYRNFDKYKCPQELVGAMQEVVERSRQLIEAGLTIAAIVGLIIAIIALGKAIQAVVAVGAISAGIAAVIVALESIRKQIQQAH